MKKIIINNLSIKDLSKILYGDETNLEDFTEEEVNEIICEQKKALERIYDCIENERYIDIHPEDLYILGDVINALNQIKFINNCDEEE